MIGTKRNERGLIDAGGRILHGLIGLTTEAEKDEIKGRVDTNENKMTQIIKHNFSHQKRMTEQINLLTETVNNISAVIDTNLNYFQLHNNIRDMETQIDFLWEQCKSLIRIKDLAKLEIADWSILKGEELEPFIANASIRWGYSVAVEKRQNTEGLSSVTRAQYDIEGHLISYAIPFVDRVAYKLYEMISIPTKVANSSDRVGMVIKDPYVLKSYDNLWYTTESATFLDRCQTAIGFNICGKTYHCAIV